MNIRPVNELTLYRYRYIIGYGLLAVLIAAVLLLNFNHLPPGLSEREQASVLTSSAITAKVELTNPIPGILVFLQQTNAVDLPFHLLQKASLHFFGLSPLGMRLPSVILAAASALCIFLLLRRWFKANAAVMMGVLVATSSWFLLISRSGSPDVMILFWTALLLLLGTLVSQDAARKHLWKALAVLSIGLSLYTPTMQYFLAAGLLASFTQPHLRYLLRTNKASLAGGLFVALVVLIPLGFTIWQQPSVALTLLGAPATLPDPLTFVKNLATGLSQLANPFAIQLSDTLTPLLSLPMLALAAAGVTQMVKDWHSARSHLLLSWLALLIPAIGLGLSGTLAPLLLPLMLTGAIGLQSLIRYWYKLFPKNPYARVFGLLPLGVLMLSIVQFNYQRYFVAQPFGPGAVASYNQDAFILHDTIHSKQYRNQRVLVVAPQAAQRLYSVDAAVVKNLEVVTAATFASTNNAVSVVVAESELAQLSETQRALLPTAKTTLLVNNRHDNALRFRVFSQ